MALGAATLLTPSVTALNAPATTASFTPSANQTLYVAGCGRKAVASGAVTQPAIADNTGGALTWTAVNEATLSGAAANLRLRVWKTTVGASPAAMTVSISGATSGAVRHTVTVVGITGAGTDTSNNNIGTNGTGDPVVVLLTQLSTSTTIGFSLCEGVNAVAQPSGYGELEDVALGGTIRVETVALAGTTTATLAWSSTNTDAVAFAVEVKAAVVTTTLQMTSGAYVIAGKPVGLLAGRRLQLTAGAYVVAGQAVGLLAGRRAQPTAGAYITAGQVVGLLAGRLLSAATGAYLTTGPPVHLLADRLVRPTAGVYSTTGQSANFSIPVALQPPTLLDSGAPTATGSSKIFPASGSITPTAGAWLVVSASARDDALSSAPTFTLTHTFAGTWTWFSQSSPVGQSRGTQWWAKVPSGAGSGAITVTANKVCRQWRWVVCEVAGHSAAVVANTVTFGIASATPSTVLPRTPLADSYVVTTVVNTNATSTCSPVSGDAQLTQVGGSATLLTSLMVEYRTGSTSTTVGATGCQSATSNLLFGLEIMQAKVAQPAAGAYVTTGVPVAFSIQHGMRLSQGAYLTVGAVQAFYLDRRLQLAHGAYSTNGQPLRFGRALSPASGVYLTQGAATQRFLLNHRLSLAAGGYALIGHDLVFHYLPALVLASGSYNQAGGSVTFRLNQKILVGAGAYLTVGQPLGLTIQRGLLARSGAYLTAGQPVRLSFARRLALTRGVYNQVGTALSFGEPGVSRMVLVKGVIRPDIDGMLRLTAATSSGVIYVKIPSTGLLFEID